MFLAVPLRPGLPSFPTLRFSSGSHLPAFHQPRDPELFHTAFFPSSFCPCVVDFVADGADHSTGQASALSNNPGKVVPQPL